MMAKMRLEEKQMANKFRKEKGLPELDETEKAAPTFTRQRRGRDDRKDGARGQRGGRGRGRGAMPPPGPVPIPPQMMGGMGGMGQMGGMGPFVPGDFRTPPFPGLEGEFRKKRFKKTSVFTNPLHLLQDSSPLLDSRTTSLPASHLACCLGASLGTSWPGAVGDSQEEGGAGLLLVSLQGALPLPS